MDIGGKLKKYWSDPENSTKTSVQNNSIGKSNRRKAGN